MLKRNTREESPVINSAVLYRYTGVLLVWLGLSANPVFAISISPDALENSMNVLSLSADCAGENVSDHRLVCQGTLAEIAKSHIAGKIEGKVTDIGMNQLGKITGKLGMKSFSLATKGAMRALGPTGKVIASWKFGRRVGTELSDHLITPSIEQYLQEKGREESNKIRQHTELLKGNKAVAGEYRKLLMARGPDEANAYLDKQFRVAGEPAEATYDVQKELDRMERMKKLAESMDEDAARQRNTEREAQREMLSGDGESPTEGEQEESESLLSMADDDVSDTEFDAAEEVSDIGDAESTPVASDTGTGENDDRRSSIEDELAQIANEQLEGGGGNQRDTDSNLQSGDGEEMEKQADSDAQQYAGELVAVPAGSFRMGDLSGEGNPHEKPVHSVRVPAFKLGKYEVTFAQWDACVADGGCGGYRPGDEGWGRGNRPVINVSWDDIQSFIQWLNGRTGGNYRLPSEAEWEYAVRAGSTTKYSWGDSIGSNRANCNRCGSRWDYQQTAPVGSFSANAWGLHDMHGNVSEWVEDCGNGNYAGAPSDGCAWTSGDCSRRVIRGGSWGSLPWFLRAAGRSRGSRSDRYGGQGFRLVQDK